MTDCKVIERFRWATCVLALLLFATETLAFVENYAAQDWMTRYTAFISGFTLGFTLILAIGAQNAFVLKQGLIKQHVFLVCAICAVSDAILIALGVSGFSELVSRYPSAVELSRYGGALFLAFYALKNFISALGKNQTLNPAESVPDSVAKIASICLAFTWLNPHVYLDTVMLLGAFSTKYEAEKLEFALGAISASFVFFFSLGYGARILTPLFNKPVSWRILDTMMGILMSVLAVSLTTA